MPLLKKHTLHLSLQPDQFYTYTLLKNYRFRLFLKKSMVYIRALDLWRKKKMSGVNFLILAAVIVGVLAGLAGALLRMLTHTIESYLQNLQWDYKYYLFF